MVKVIKKTLVICAAAATILPAYAAKGTRLEAGVNASYEVMIKTSEGKVKLRLYNDTPVHRDNFAKLAEEGFYNHLLFHRVIKEFMIQCGDPQSIDANHVKIYGNADSGYKLDPEIRPGHFHRRGVLAAAREGDEVNPERRSSGSQFYIVVGKVHNDSTLAIAREKIAERGGMTMTPEREAVYRKLGGTPHLDGSYTIFGEVRSGMRTVEKISRRATDLKDRPKDDVYIQKVEVKLVRDSKAGQTILP